MCFFLFFLLHVHSFCFSRSFIHAVGGLVFMVMKVSTLGRCHSVTIYIFRRLLSIIMMKSVHVSSVHGSGEEVHLVSRNKQTNAFSKTNKKHFNFRDALLLYFFFSLSFSFISAFSRTHFYVYNGKWLKSIEHIFFFICIQIHKQTNIEEKKC